MVKIRLRRVGAKNRPIYRVVVADARSPRDGAFIEIIGHYNPLTDPESFTIDEEKALGWLKRGAQPTDTVARLLSKSGVMQKFKPGSVRRSESAKPETKTTTKITTKTTAKTTTKPTAKTTTKPKTKSTTEETP